MNTATLANDLLGQLHAPFTGEALFDCLTDVVFFFKNRHGQYVVINDTLVERFGRRHKSELIGKTASEVMRAPLGTAWEAQDREVLQTGQALLQQLEMHLYPTRDIGWCLTTKLPLRGRRGEVVGLVGVSQDLRVPNATSDDYEQISSAVAQASSRLASPPSIDELATFAKMSRYQLDRRMRIVFGLTTGQWLLKLRIDQAERELRDTDQPIAVIALNAGYRDQSAFTRQFRRATGLSPREYRRLHQPSDAQE